MSASAQEQAGIVVAGGMPPATTRPQRTQAIPVRHWGRWIFAGIIVFLLVALIYSLVNNSMVEWSVVRQYLFAPLTLRGLVLTIELTIIAMIIGAAGAVMLAMMRLSNNLVLSSIAWVYIWFFRGTPVYVQILIWGISEPCIRNYSSECRSPESDSLTHKRVSFSEHCLRRF